MKMKFYPKQAGEFIVKHAKSVRCHDDGIATLSKKVVDFTISHLTLNTVFL